MKNLTLLFFVLFSFVSFSQTKKIDSTEICFPYQVGKQILLDLNECDKNIELLKSSEKEVILLNKKILSKDTVINFQKVKIEKDSIIINKTNEKFEIVNNENKKLQDDINELKLRNKIFNIVSGAIIGGLTYIIIFK
jgi:hypothetical protein